MNKKIRLHWIRPVFGILFIAQAPPLIAGWIYGYHSHDTDRLNNDLPFDFNLFWEGYMDVYFYAYVYILALLVFIFVGIICFSPIEQVRKMFR